MSAQDKPAGPAPVAAPAVEKAKPVIQRFSAGGVVSFSGFSLMKDDKSTATTAINSTTNRVSNYASTQKGFRLGVGGTVQGMVTDKFAVVAGFMMRRVKWETNNDFTEGTKVTKQSDQSSADFWEVPIVLRRYSKSRMESGVRWYGEGGLALRRVRNIRSSLQTTTPDNKTVCCDESPVPAAHRTSEGFVVGGGFHMIDQFGIRFIPGVRYTRWSQQTFDRFSVKSNPNQLEAIIAITF